MSTKTYYTTSLKTNSKFDTYELAEEQAKRYVAPGSGYTQVEILQAIAIVKQPTPEAMVVKLT